MAQYTTENLFDIDDNDESLLSRTSGTRFGLNTGKVVLFELNRNAGKDGAEANAVDIHVQADGADKPVRARYYVDANSLYQNGNAVQPGEEGYEKLYKEDLKQKIAVIKQTVKALGVTEEKWKSTLTSVDMSDVPGTFQKFINLIPANYKEVPVDFFLEWQWNIPQDADRTFLEFPKNMKGGRIIDPATKPVGKWKQVYDEVNGLSYVDDAGNKHNFTRSTDYLKSNKGIPQGENVTMPVWAEGSSSAPKADDPKSSTW